LNNSDCIGIRQLQLYWWRDHKYEWRQQYCGTGSVSKHFVLYVETCSLLPHLLRRHDPCLRLWNFSPFLDAQVKTFCFTPSKSVTSYFAPALQKSALCHLPARSSNKFCISVALLWSPAIASEDHYILLMLLFIYFYSKRSNNDNIIIIIISNASVNRHSQNFPTGVDIHVGSYSPDRKRACCVDFCKFPLK